MTFLATPTSSGIDIIVTLSNNILPISRIILIMPRNYASEAQWMKSVTVRNPEGIALITTILK